MSSTRFLPLDGLRNVAVLGVLWAHVWAFHFAEPPLKLPGVSIDWHKLFSIVGTGVDLFFVLSGFCIYKAFLGLSRTGT